MVICQQLLTEIAQKEELIGSLAEFFLQRLRTQLQEARAIDYDLVNAVLGEVEARNPTILMPVGFRLGSTQPTATVLRLIIRMG